MKKLFLIVLATFVLTSYSQKKQNHKNKNLFSTEQKAILKTKRMALNLDLDENQQAQILALNKIKVEKREMKKEEAKKRRLSNQKLTSDEIFERKKIHLDNSLEYNKNLRGILNEKQYGKFKKNNHSKKRRKYRRKS